MTSSLLPYLSLLATVAAGTTPAAAAAVAGRSVCVVLHDASSVPVLCVVCEGVCLRESSIEVDGAAAAWLETTSPPHQMALNGHAANSPRFSHTHPNSPAFAPTGRPTYVKRTVGLVVA